MEIYDPENFDKMQEKVKSVIQKLMKEKDEEKFTLYGFIEGILPHITKALSKGASVREISDCINRCSPMHATTASKTS